MKYIIEIKDTDSISDKLKPFFDVIVELLRHRKTQIMISNSKKGYYFECIPVKQIKKNGDVIIPKVI